MQVGIDPTDTGGLAKLPDKTILFSSRPGHISAPTVDDLIGVQGLYANT